MSWLTGGARVAITGGSGFIGHHFHVRFEKMAVPHALLDLRAPAWNRGGADLVIGDIRTEAAVRRALVGHDAVLHLAAAHHDFGIAPETFQSVNVEGTRVVCRVAEEEGIRRICFLSSVAVYGDGEIGADERTPCKPGSPYGRTKLEAEAVLQEWVRGREGRSLLIIRPTVTFGAWHFANMYTLIHQIARRLYLPVGSGSNRKSLVYVENLVDATLDLWQRDDVPSVRIVNAVDKPDMTSAEITRAVYRALGRRIPSWSVPLPLALSLAKPLDWFIAATGANLSVSGARIRKLVDETTVYGASGLEEARVSKGIELREGIERMVSWYVAEGRHLPVDKSLPPARPIPFEASP